MKGLNITHKVVFPLMKKELFSNIKILKISHNKSLNGGELLNVYKFFVN